jgi:hypothetical protein
MNITTNSNKGYISRHSENIIEGVPRMSADRALVCVFIILALVFNSFIAICTDASTAPRVDGEVKPNWQTNDQWIYRVDLTVFQTYSFNIFNIGTNTSRTLTVELRLTPTTGANQVKYSLVAINTMTAEYKLSKNGQGWENGSWAMIVLNNDGDPNYTNGQIFDKGNYMMTEICNGELYLDNHNIDFKRGNWSETNQWTFWGDLTFTFSVTNTTTVSTSNGIDAVFKPDWDVSPMNVGDSWKQVNELTEIIQHSFTWGGDLKGSGTTTIVNDYTYDYTWLVASKAQKTVSNTWMGSTTFSDAYKLTRSGSFAWTTTDGTNTTSGITNPGPYALWYAGDGDNFDACLAVDFNGTYRIMYSTCKAFLNTRPHFEIMPAPEGNINSDEVWIFKESVDYVVSDPDPGNAGNLTYTLKKSLPDHTNILNNMTIDPDTGEIWYTPNQKDVADGYLITINVSDNYDKGKLSAEASFILNIKNKNHAPMIKSELIQYINIEEGDNYAPTWTLADAFHDKDMDANPLMGNSLYDPNEHLNYSVSNNGSIRVVCPNGLDLTSANQCTDPSFTAIDWKFPRDQPIDMTITATDRYGQNVSQQLNVAVTHVNHAPRAIKDIADFGMDADTQAAIDLKKILTDMDVYNPNYSTIDALTFQKQGGNHLTVTITGSKATIKPERDWCGEEVIFFSAIDKWGESATAQLRVNVSGCNEPPIVSSFWPTTDPIIFETSDGTEIGTPGTVKLSIGASSPYDYTLSYNWTVEDGSNIYKATSHSQTWAFYAAFHCDFINGKFCGGTESKTYIVTAYVTDGTFEIEAHKWYVTVTNVNRRPVLSGIEVFTINSAGLKTPLVEKTPLNYTIAYGKLIELDVSDTVTDPDLFSGAGQDLDELKFEWASNIGGSLGSSPDISVGAGIKKAPASIALKPGTHVITVKVTDQNNQTAAYTITIKIVGMQSGPDIHGFDGVTFLVATIIVVTIVTYRVRK